MRKQYMISKIGSRYVTVFRVVDGKIDGYTEISERNIVGFTKALEEIGYEAAYDPTEYEQLYIKAVQAMGKARAEYIRAKEKQLVLDDTETQKLHGIIKRLDYVELPY